MKESPLTKREQFALAICAGLVANQRAYDDYTKSGIARASVEQADELIEALRTMKPGDIADVDE